MAAILSLSTRSVAEGETYVYPKANYLLHHVRAYKTQLESINSELARDLRHLFHINQSNTTALFHASRATLARCGRPSSTISRRVDSS